MARAIDDRHTWGCPAQTGRVTPTSCTTPATNPGGPCMPPLTGEPEEERIQGYASIPWLPGS